ncbi:lysophospholipase [Sistotremastrum suecicum HHB10207 ss-3]|uniref:Lysophospholipase n=1 Tax=Sistotremastrum suecicum HHB10207 ss-3 TaxID=1314776 RepID=A0A166GS95_9AGAM|nr:lysophospholipase [Sistotremastrum suecicum HHB10207 ss-3]
MAETQWLTGPKETSFFVAVYSPSTPAKAVVLFLHGFGEHIGRYEAVFPRWTEHNIAVVTFDQRGFGRTALDVEHKSKDSSYGKTSTVDHMRDADFFLKWAREKFPEVPVFLLGHSMGGALALAFPTRSIAWPSRESVKSLSGVIATSPLLRQAVPASKIQRWLGGKLSVLSPWTTIPAPVKAEDLTHDPAINEAYLKDPLILQKGTLKGLSDMLNWGEHISDLDYQDWPKDLPVLLLHGTADKVTSHLATEKFFNEVNTSVKNYVPFEGGYHELHNEPDGVREKVIDECISWVEARIDPVKTRASL